MSKSPVSALPPLQRMAAAVACATAFGLPAAHAADDTPTSVEIRGARGAAISELIDGPFGAGRSPLEVPRSVSSVSAELLRTAGADNLGDLIKVSPATFSPTGFGVPSLPTIRGQLGEIYENGLRRQGGNNGFGLPLSFNALEGLDVIKGPPPVVLGASQRVGGFVNLRLKRPQLDDNGGYVELGTGSWQHHSAQLDLNRSLTPGQSALRVSAELLDQGSYYDYVHHRSQDLYLAYRLQPDARSSLQASIEYYKVDFSDSAGINRPTQALIDHGLYITGQGVQPNGSSVPGAGALIHPTGVVQIPRSRVLTDPLDTDQAVTWIGHLDYTRRLDSGLRYQARNMLQHLERNEVAQNSFVEIIKGADTFEHRSEWVLEQAADAATGAGYRQTTFGGALRYNHVIGYSQFDTEADLPVDLTGPLSNRRIPLTPAQQAQLVQLRPGLYVSPGAQYPRAGQAAGYLTSDTTGSDSYQAGLFIQHEFDLSPQWRAMAGARGDQYYVSAHDPLPPPGQVAAFDSVQHFLKGYNASLTWRPRPELAVYGAASRSRSTANSIAGGTVLGSGNRINPANFATRSDLFELGAKWAPPAAAWSLDGAVYSQRRSLRNRDGSNSGIRARGAEAQWRYQHAGLLAQGGLAYLDARYDHSASYQDTAKVADAFDASRPDLIAGTGVGAPSFAAFPASTRRVQGLPSLTAAALLGYESEHGAGGSLSATFSNGYPLDYLATVRIRSQYSLDASAFYRWKRTGTELRLRVNNLTNQKNWSPVFDAGYFGATDVAPGLPVNASITLRQQF